MKIAVIVFPGSNCDIDLYEALKTVCGADVDYVDHQQTSLAGYDAVMLPGAFRTVTTCGPGRLPASLRSCRKLSTWPTKASRSLGLATVSRF